MKKTQIEARTVYNPTNARPPGTVPLVTPLQPQPVPQSQPAPEPQPAPQHQPTLQPRPAPSPTPPLQVLVLPPHKYWFSECWSEY